MRYTPRRGSILRIRQILWIVCLLGILVSMAGLSVFNVLAAFGPFQYRDGVLYGVQRWAEASVVSLDQRPGGKAQHLIDFANRRNLDLVAEAGSPQERGALLELERSVYSAVLAATRAGAQDTETLRPQLVDLLGKVQVNLTLLKVAPVQDPANLKAFRAWLQVLMERAVNPNLALESLLANHPAPLAGFAPAEPTGANAWARPTAGPTEAPIPPHFVSFPPDSSGAKHLFYPLTGKHAALDCMACHGAGTFAGTGNQCEDCHSQQAPSAHYPGTCTTCHVAAGWKEIHFDHKDNQAGDCSTCHQRNAPPNHYAAQCSACHTVSAWRPATFNHAAVNASNCQSCHAAVRPANHYPFQCSLCHSTQAWKSAHFDHSGSAAAQCSDCHGKNKPANHFEGQCSACHSTSAWKPAQFNHAAANATDCASCHAGKKPANHYEGQCSACHSTDAWKSAKFNHAAANAVDCQSCHNAVRPAGHYTWQCSTCHSTSSWSDVSFNHSFPMDHNGAGGQCATCHPSNTKAWTCTSCHAQAVMDEKHTGFPGYSTNCIACHPNGKKPGG
jgi:hypothetical protein